MILENYVVALTRLVQAGKISVSDIKDEAYRQEVIIRLDL